MFFHFFLFLLNKNSVLFAFPSSKFDPQLSTKKLPFNQMNSSYFYR